MIERQRDGVREKSEERRENEGGRTKVREREGEREKERETGE